jgi:hypothetical protein
MRAAHREWVLAQGRRWAQRAETFWDGVVDGLERMFFDLGIPFWSELSRTHTCLWLVMRLENKNTVRIGSMTTRLVHGLHPVVTIRFEFSCLEDIVAIWKSGISSVRGLMRCVDVVPEVSDLTATLQCGDAAPLVWDGWVMVTCLKPCCEKWEPGKNFRYSDNIMHSREMADCLFRGGGGERMRWIYEDPFRYSRSMTRRERERQLIENGEKIFRTSVS